MTYYELFLSNLKPSWILVVAVRSEGRRASIIQKYFHKWLFEELTRDERTFFLLHQEPLRDPLIYSALRASTLGFPKKTIRQGLDDLSQLLFSTKPPSYEKHIGYRTLKVSFETIEKYYIPKQGVKYTGWKRHQNDHGSLAPERPDPFYLDPYSRNDNISLFLEMLKEIKPGSPGYQINNIRIKT